MKHSKVSFLAFVAAIFFILPSTLAQGETAAADVTLVTAEGAGAAIGTIVISDTTDGVQLDINLQGLPPGEHGFHVHEFGDCGPKGADGKIGAALAAGGHYDPHKTNKHLGPGKEGHKGDLPLLTAQQDGTIKTTVSVAGLTVKELKNRSLMIHAGGDNYSDTPEVLGGGGARIACGIIK